MLPSHSHLDYEFRLLTRQGGSKATMNAASLHGRSFLERQRSATSCWIRWVMSLPLSNRERITSSYPNSSASAGDREAEETWPAA